MKRILLAGYGNIAHAFEKIMNEQEQNGSFTLTICDLKDGQDIFDFLPRHHDEFDVVVNTSVANSIEIARMCIDYGLDCIDVAGFADGIETDDTVSTADYIEDMKRILCWPTHSRVMFGFGINPGILEHVYQRYKPQGPHYAFELEHDDSVSDEYEVFGTWSPLMYAEESCRAELVVGTRQNVIDVTQQLKEEGGTIRLTYHGSERHYLPVPHEELLSMLLLAIPVPHCLKGEDQAGILFWDTKERLYWVKSVVDNQTTWKRYGTNAVCWETATGAWIAYRLLDAASTDHPHTMTELSQLMPEKIDALLKQIGLTFETEEQPFSIDEFKQNIMRFF